MFILAVYAYFKLNFNWKISTILNNYINQKEIMYLCNHIIYIRDDIKKFLMF